MAAAEGDVEPSQAGDEVTESEVVVDESTAQAGDGEEDLNLTEIRGKFDSLSVLLEQLPLFDMKVIATNPVRVWKHDGDSWTEGWKPHSTQLSAGAKVQISKCQKISKVTGKGWNENSEYWMGCVGGNKWIRLINFRGVATVVPNLDVFHERVEFVTIKVMGMESLILNEKERRQNAETRMKSASERMVLTDKAKMMTEERLREFEDRFKEAEKTMEERIDVYEKRIQLAQREATEAQVLMKYFERRMIDSENTRKNLEEIILQNEATMSELDKQLKASETREIELRQKLEESERARAELERLMSANQNKFDADDLDDASEISEVKGKRKRKRRQNSKKFG